MAIYLPASWCLPPARDRSAASARVESENAFVRVIWAIAPRGLPYDRCEHEAGNEAADMGPPRDAPAGGRHKQFACALNHLHEEPQHGEDEGGDFEEERKKENRDHDDQAREGEQARVASEHAG